MRRPATIPVALVGTLIALLALMPTGAAALSPPVGVGVDLPPEGWPTPPSLGARNAILVDAATGQVLVAVRPDERVPVASTIKTLTALTAMARTEPQDVVTVGDEVEGLPFYGASVGLEPGDRWTVEELLAAVIARSGNDAANTLARHVAGDVEGFMEMMRQDAHRLGLEGLRIETVHGLGDLDRLSARDLATIGRAALDEEGLAPVLRAAAVELPGIGRIASRNELLATYPGADGVKTGYTAPAGRTLIASATRDGRRLVAVVLGSTGLDGHFRDAAALLDHGFDAYHPVPAAADGRAGELRRPGRWVSLDAPAAARLLVPAGLGVVPTFRLVPPIEVDDAPDEPLTIRWGEEELGRVPVEIGTGAGGAPSVPGAWLTDRAYAAMRAATRADAWPEGTP